MDPELPVQGRKPMNIQEFYRFINEDFNDFFSRLPNVSSIEKFVRQFEKDQSYSKLLSSVQDENVQNTFAALLTLKGIALNLGFRRLSDSLDSMLVHLRKTGIVDREQCAQFLQEISIIYNNIIDGIHQLEL